MVAPTSEPLPAALYVVATPIGALEDITLRALRILASVAAIACEDTRHFQRLAQRHHISTPLFALHQHNEQEATGQVLARLARGEAIALVTDAGTPGLSDPGAWCVMNVHQAGHRVIPVPGASAMTAAISAAGAQESRMLFLGFLPPKSRARQQVLQEVQQAPWTLVFYEAPHRLLETLQDMAELLGCARTVLVARELTKVHEEILSTTLQQALVHFSQHSPKGEFVLILPGQKSSAPLKSDQATAALTVLLEHLPPAKAATVAARLTGAAREELYAIAVDRKR